MMAAFERCASRRSGLLRTGPRFAVPALREPAAIAKGERMMFGDTTVRIAALWPFPQPSIPDTLIEAFEDKSDGLPAELEQLVAPLTDAEQAALFDGHGGDADMAWEEMACDAYNAGVSGFICLAECPVFESNGRGSASFSWGRYRSRRFFGSTAEEAIAAAVAWADGEFAKVAKAAA